MANQFAIIGLGKFGVAVLEKLHEITNEIIIIDKDSSVIERFKNWARKAHIVNLRSSDIIEQSLGETVDTAIIDVGNDIESAVIIISTLKKLSVKNIIICCDSQEQGQIYSIVGATQVVIPTIEAAERIVPLLISGNLLNFSPISKSLVIAEIKIPETYVGKTLIEAKFRQAMGINVVAIRRADTDDYFYFEPTYKLEYNDIVLCVGSIENIEKFAGISLSRNKNFVHDFINIFLKKRN